MRPLGKSAMKNLHTCAYAIALLGLMTNGSNAATAESTACLDLVKECFAYTAAPRDACFVAVSKHPFCANSESSRLAGRRAEFSALLPNDTESGPSLVGPQLVDRGCVTNFDNAWLGSLVQGTPSPETYTTLRQTLESCARASASDIMRP
jgi:hypothetical protein